MPVFQIPYHVPTCSVRMSCDIAAVGTANAGTGCNTGTGKADTLNVGPRISKGVNKEANILFVGPVTGAMFGTKGIAGK